MLKNLDEKIIFDLFYDLNSQVEKSFLTYSSPLS